MGNLYSVRYFPMERYGRSIKTKTQANYAGNGVYINQFTKYSCQMKFQNFEHFPCKFSFYLTLTWLLFVVYLNFLINVRKDKFSFTKNKLTNNVFIPIAIHPSRQCLWSTNIVWSTFNTLKQHKNRLFLFPFEQHCQSNMMVNTNNSNNNKNSSVLFVNVTAVDGIVILWFFYSQPVW